MPSKSELRDAFENFLGKERYEKFIAKGFSPRFVYWQEVEINRFLQASPDLNIKIFDLEAALKICEVHKEELQVDAARVFHGNIDFSNSYLATRRRLFPHAALDPISTEGAPAELIPSQVYFCPKCRDVRKEWQSAKKT